MNERSLRGGVLDAGAGAGAGLGLRANVRDFDGW